MEADPIPKLKSRLGFEKDNMGSSLDLSTPLSGQHRVVGAALENLGNTCFLNAVLQCLTHTVPLVEKLIDLEHSNCNCGEKKKFCSLSALKNHIKHCLVSSEYYISPKDIAQNLSKISPGLQLGQQEDAHEFLQSLLDAVHTCCHKCTTKDCPSTIDEDSIVKQVFGGRLRSQLQCCSCGHRSDTYEPLLDLSLEIGDANSIIDALESFTKVEKIEDDIKLTCDGCKAQVSMEKQFKLEQAPEVLALHLKRFENNGFFLKKITKHVGYPLELDLKQFVVCPTEDLKYDLYAIVVHLGSSYSGHYFSIIRSSENDWHQMDDTLVYKVSTTEVLDQKAYILFYIKRGSSCWFSSLLEKEKIRCLEKAAHTSPTSVLNNVEEYDLRLSLTIDPGCSSSSSMPDSHEGSRQYIRTYPTGSANDASLNHEPRCASSPTNKFNYDNSLGAMPERCEGSRQYINSYPISPTTEASPVHEHGTIRTNNFNQANGTQPTFKMCTVSQHPILYAFETDTSEDENEATFSKTQLGPKVTKSAVVKPPVLEPVKEQRKIESYNRDLRGMPKNRRNDLLACIASQNRFSGKHASTNSSLCVASKRRRFH